MTLVLFQFLPLLLGNGRRRAFAGSGANDWAKPLQIVFFAAAIGLIAVMAPKLVHDVDVGVRIERHVGDAVHRARFARRRMASRRPGARGSARAVARHGAS